MFNFVNGNPFNKKIESAVSTGQENKRQGQQQQRDEEHNYLEDDEGDEVSIAQHSVLSEDDVKYLVEEYLGKLRSEHCDNVKVLERLEKFSKKFDVKKFMKQNPEMTISDFNMIMYNETSGLL